MPYPCCCGPKSGTANCPACALTSDPDINSPVRFQANLPQARVFVSSGIFNPWQSYATVQPSTAVFTNLDFLAGEEPPYTSCCWASPPQILCVSPLLQNRIRSLRFSATIALSTNNDATELTVALRYTLYNHLDSAPEFGVFGSPVVQPTFYPCLGNFLGGDGVIGGGGSEVRATCNEVRDTSVTLNAAAHDKNTQWFDFNCGGTVRRYSFDSAAHTASIEWLPE